MCHDFGFETTSTPYTGYYDMSARGEHMTSGNYWSLKWHRVWINIQEGAAIWGGIIAGTYIGSHIAQWAAVLEIASGFAVAASVWLVILLAIFAAIAIYLSYHMSQRYNGDIQFALHAQRKFGGLFYSKIIMDNQKTGDHNIPFPSGLGGAALLFAYFSTVGNSWRGTSV